jgi:mRNA interferase MazF
VGGLDLTAGRIVWSDLDPPVGHEQGGRRPCVVISSTDFTDVITQMAILVPCTTRRRGWINHVQLIGDTGLTATTFAITEQPRTVSVRRVHGTAGYVDAECLTEIMRWVAVWLHPAA